MILPKNIRVFDTAESLSEGAAQFIISIAQKSIEARGRFAIALSGGNTPEKLYSLLSTPQYSIQIPWDKTFTFWGDERCLPLDDKNNNAYNAKTTLLDKVNIPAANIHRIQTNLPPAEAANAYEKEIKTFFGNQPPCFDLILLGLGENGHTASLFPGTEVLNEKERLLKEVYVKEINMFRITMTVPLINESRNIIFLVSGKGKAVILKTILTSPFQPNKYPAQLIKPVNGELDWFVDKEAFTHLV